MRAFARLALVVTVCALADTASAGASSTPFGYRPDPSLRTASLTDLQSKVRDSCASTQARLQASTPVAMARPCSCYASRVIRSLDPSEIDAYRSTGVFNDSARGKALSALDQCKLRRPV